MAHRNESRFAQDLSRGHAPPTTKTPRQLATDVSAEENRQVDAVTRRMQASLEKVLGNVGGTVEDFLKKVEEEASDHLDHSNPHTRRNHQNAKVCWSALLSVLKPQITREEHWARATVKDFACVYLVTRFRLTPGKDGEHVKAITVASWAGHLIFCIAYFTYDPDTNQKCGRQLLTGSEGTPVTARHQLDRHPSRRYQVLGKRELQMAIEYAMVNSREHGRGPRLQIICVMMMHFASGVRPSTAAALHAEMVELRRFMTLGDIKFYRVAPCQFDAHITYRYFKGSITTVLGTQARHVYKGVSQVHNLTFDPWWFLSYYMARDALEFSNVDDLLNSTQHEIRVTRPNEPFCVKVTQGGYDFVQPIEAATADNMSHQVRELLVKVGICCSGYGWRRGAATELEITAGSRVAGLMLHHSDAATVASRHYTMGTATIDTLGLRLCEVKEALQPGVEERLALNARIGAAVSLIAGDLANQSLANDDEDDEEEVEGEEKVAKPRKTGAMAHQVAFVEKRAEEVQEQLDVNTGIKRDGGDFKNVVDEQWPIFLAPFVPGSKTYKKLLGFSRVKQNVTGIATKPTYGYEDALEKASTEVAKASKRAMQLLYGAYDAKATLKKSVTRDTTHRLQKDGNNEDRANPSTKNMDDALDHFEQPSHMIQDALDFDGSETSPRETRMLTHLQTPTVIDIGVEEDEDEDMVREGTKDVLTFPGLSRCGVDQDKEQVLRDYIGIDAARRKDQDTDTSTGNTSANPTEELGDQEEDVPSELTTKDDRNEKAIIPNLKAPQVRGAMMRFSLAPITADREFKKHLKEDGGKIFCRNCDPFPQYQENRREFKSCRALNRHLPDHTEWHDLELRMHPKGGKPHGCPAVNCPKSFDSVAETRAHCLSDECPERTGFESMKAVDDTRVTLRAVREAKSRRIPRLRDREGISKKAAKVLASIDKESVIQHARYYKIPEQGIKPKVVTRFVELANEFGNNWDGD